MPSIRLSCVQNVLKQRKKNFLKCGIQESYECLIAQMPKLRGVCVSCRITQANITTFKHGEKMIIFHKQKSLRDFTAQLGHIILYIFAISKIALSSALFKFKRREIHSAFYIKRRL